MPARRHRMRLGLKHGAAALVLAGFSGVAAHASVISPTPTLTPANGVYVGESSPGCFPTVNICVGAGTFRIASATSSFGPSGEDIAIDGVFTAALTTNIGHLPLGRLTLSGSAEEGVVGRLGPGDLGTWAATLSSLDLSGIVEGELVTVGLDPNNPTTGTDSIVPAGADFLITSFFDVFAEISVGSLTVSREMRIDLVPVPEPATFALLGLPLAMLVWRRRGPARGGPARGGSARG